jgi:hypothetical protein
MTTLNKRKKSFLNTKATSRESSWIQLNERRLTRTGLLLLLLLLTLPAVVQAQFTYTTNNRSITITGYTGTNAVMTIPSSTNGLPVTSIGDDAFSFCTSLTSITIPDSVTSIGEEAFYGCTVLQSGIIGNGVTNIGQYAFWDCLSLTGVYFQGNAPSLHIASSVFADDFHATVYYLAGTSGWGTTFGSRPAALWNPQVQATGASFGVRTNTFSFTITGTSNLVIVVEACTILANPIWYPLATNTLTGGSCYFSDPQWTNYPARFYRLRSP